MTERLIADQREITGLTTIEWKQPMWKETTLFTDRAVQFATAKTYVFSDSVLSLSTRRIGGYLECRCCHRRTTWRQCR